MPAPQLPPRRAAWEPPLRQPAASPELAPLPVRPAHKRLAPLAASPAAHSPAPLAQLPPLLLARPVLRQPARPAPVHLVPLLERLERPVLPARPEPRAWVLALLRSEPLPLLLLKPR